MARTKSKPEMKYYLLEEDRILDESESLSTFVEQMVASGDEDCPFRVIKGYELLVFAEEEPAEIQYYAEDK